MIYLNGAPIEVTRFPDGTSQVWRLPDNTVKLTGGQLFDAVAWEFSGENEFLHLAQLKTLLDNRCHHVTLKLKYLPYGRQDKKVSNCTTFALHTFAKLLNSLNFYSVQCTDPHSEEAGKLINNFSALYPVTLVGNLRFQLKPDLVCYPDTGAYTKYQYIYNAPFIHGEKVRDQTTGLITSYKLVGSAAGKRVLIVDDICDGGATFKLLAQDLYASGAEEVNLFVTHGIFSKGLKILHDAGIKRVFTQDGEAYTSSDQVLYRSYK